MNLIIVKYRSMRKYLNKNIRPRERKGAIENLGVRMTWGGKIS